MTQIPLFAALELPIEGENYRILKSEHSDYKDLIDKTFNSPKIILDIETVSKDPIKGYIRLIQVKAHGGDKPLIINLGGLWENRDQIKESHSYFFKALKAFLKLESKLVIGQVISFDLRFLRYQYGIRTKCYVSDTQIGTKVLLGDFGASCAKDNDSVLPGGYGLKNLAEKLVGLDVDKTEQKSDWSEVLSQSQIDYAAKDIDITEKVYDKLVNLYLGKDTSPWVPQRLITPGILKAWKLENRVIVKALDVEFNGLPCDEKLLNLKIEQLTGIYDSLMCQWDALKIPYKPGQNQALVKYFQSVGILPKSECIEHPDGTKTFKNPKLNKEALAPLIDHPEIKLLAQIRAITALLNNLKGFKTSIDYSDGRIHTQYKTLTGVGRFSSGATSISKAYPNLQSISAKNNPILEEFGLESVRQVVKPPEGYAMAVIDLAGAHGRIAAGLSNDQFAIEINNNLSIDSHSKVAVYVAKTQGVDWDSDYISKAYKTLSHPDHQKAEHYRSTAKNTYYGWLNGAGAKTIQAQIAANTGKVPKLEDCQAALDGCRQLYKGISGFVKAVLSKLSKDTFQIKDEFGNYRTFCQYSPEGLHHLCYELVPSFMDKSKLQPPYTKVVAATWQLIEATAVKEGFLAVSELCDAHPEWELKIFLLVHDEIDILCKLEYASQAITACNAAFNDAFQRHLKNGVLDGRKTDWKKLLVNDWSEK